MHTETVTLFEQAARGRGNVQRGRGLRGAWLTLRVNIQALMSRPVRWIGAHYWLATRRRVRGHSRLAPLLGSTRHAYRLWIERHEPVVVEAVLAEAGGTGVPTTILPVIESARDPARLERTLRSLEAAGAQRVAVLGPFDAPAPAAGGAALLAVADCEQALAAARECGAGWLLPIAAGDLVPPHALQAYAAAATADPRAAVVFADDDLVDGSGRRHSPHFKPAWNPALFENHDYLSGAAMVRAGWLEAAADVEAEGIGAALRAALAGRPGAAAARLPLVLHHRERRPVPRIPADARPSGERPPVSVIVPTRNRAGLLRECLAGLDRTDYGPVERIVVDNDSDDPETLALLQELEEAGGHVLRHPGPFNFAAMNNRAAEVARGKLLCLLNNDIEVIEPGWLAAMAQHALREDIGAVGARLLYPDRTIQHAGVVTGIGGGAGHAHRGLRQGDEGYFARALLPQYATAVTGACLVVARDRFLAVGGMDEARFAVAFNDVDLCLALNTRGWQSFYEPRACLIHHESKSRGNDAWREHRERFAAELAALKSKWRTDVRPDPYHHPQLSPFTDQFVVAL